MMKSQIALFLLLFLFAACEHRSSIPMNAGEISELKTIAKESSLALPSSSDFHSKEEFLNLTSAYFDEAVGLAQKINLEKSFIIKGQVYDKEIFDRHSICHFELRNDKVIIFGTTTVAKIYVTHMTNLKKGSDPEYCINMATQNLSEAVAYVYKKPSVEEYIAEIKKAIVAKFVSASGRMESIQETSQYFLKLSDKEIFSINLKSSNPESIFNSKSDLVQEEIDSDEFPRELPVLLLVNDQFYAGNLSTVLDRIDYIGIKTVNLSEYLNSK